MCGPNLAAKHIATEVLLCMPRSPGKSSLPLRKIELPERKVFSLLIFFSPASEIFKSENRICSSKKLYITLILDDISREGIQERPEADGAMCTHGTHPERFIIRLCGRGTHGSFLISCLQLKAHSTPLTASVSKALLSLHVF